MADLASWPDTLPLPRASGYGIQPVAAFARTDMDDGTTRQRRRFTSTPSHISVAWMFSLGQYALFEAFLQYDIGLGADWFAVGLLSGMGVTQVRARFMDSPPFKATLSDSRTYWDVTGTLEVRALPVVSRDVYAVLRAYADSDLIAGDRGLHQFIHVRLPGAGGWD